jgi:KUP system potassium uptake protein
MSDTTSASSPARARHWAWLAALGIVYGDLGTSPLYTLQTVVQAVGGHFTPASALGVLSLIFWTLIITVSIKYCVFVMRADNHGEGGILALMSLVGANSLRGRALILTSMGLLGAALIYGDGVITPAISVLSALEGVNVVTSALKPYVMPMAVGVLLALFAAQKVGTARIGAAFGPIMLLWFVVIAMLGLSGIVRHPVVLSAIDPRYAISFLAHGGRVGFFVLGGVFLCITGAEALYADMGHLGRGPIKRSWYGIVLPALLINYAGQTSCFLDSNAISGNPFFTLAPTWAIYPLVVLATVATIIASQAIITGSFSMTRQAMQLGWLPGVNIRQTSDEAYGQIYVPVVNWLMMFATTGITIAFQSSDRLAGAYGTAVSTTMLLTTCLLFTAMHKVWRWSASTAAMVTGLFMIVDAAFFGANLLKIAQGGWLPLTLALLVFIVMVTWRVGVTAMHSTLELKPETPESFLANVRADRIPRVPGTAIFLTRTARQLPYLLIDYVKHMGALHRNVVTLTVRFEDIPRIARMERCGAERIAPGIWHVTVRFGYIEIPDLCAALRAMPRFEPDLDFESATYFGARDQVVHKPANSLMPRWSIALFAFMFRNSVKTVDRFNLPPENFVEIGRLIAI